MKADNPGPIARKVLESVTAAPSGIQRTEVAALVGITVRAAGNWLWELSRVGMVVGVGLGPFACWTVPGREAAALAEIARQRGKVKAAALARRNAKNAERRRRPDWSGSGRFVAQAPVWQRVPRTVFDLARFGGAA